MVRALGLAQGIWVDGRISKEEMAYLQELIKKAVEKFGKGELPWSHEDDKITLRVWAEGSTLHVFYGWNFPPKQFWKKESKGLQECFNCFPSPRGENGSPVREVWCEKPDYKFEVCPYGCRTKNGERLKGEVA